jgi:hypothetical protein
MTWRRGDDWRAPSELLRYLAIRTRHRRRADATPLSSSGHPRDKTGQDPTPSGVGGLSGIDGNCARSSAIIYVTDAAIMAR